MWIRPTEFYFISVLDVGLNALSHHVDLAFLSLCVHFCCLIASSNTDTGPLKWDPHIVSSFISWFYRLHFIPATTLFPS